MALLCVPYFLVAQISFADRLASAVLKLTQQQVTYDPSYFKITYPYGDVPANKGVCTDMVIRAYRQLGIDLQKEVHEDMRANFAVYPQNWGLKTTDKNIDHRRVPNLMTFFSRKGVSLPKSTAGSDYKAGDIVAWNLGRGLTHIGIVVMTPNSNKPMVVHNIGNGQELSDCLFSWQIIGHYRYDIKYFAY
jgi:uncharacterized protein YijF (DUF1287 family)